MIHKIENLENDEVLYFVDTSKLRFLQDAELAEQGYYLPYIKTMIRLGDTSKDDVFHHFMVQNLPPIADIDVVRLNGGKIR